MTYYNRTNTCDKCGNILVGAITIYKSSSNGVHWYEKYRVDEKVYNDAYHNLDDGDLKFIRKA